MAKKWALEDLAGIGELAEALGVTKQVVSNWAIRYSDFPRPLVHLAAGPVWSRIQVIAWRDGRDWKPGKHRS